MPHGDRWPMVVPDFESKEDLYALVSAPIMTGVCSCEARCECDDHLLTASELAEILADDEEYS